MSDALIARGDEGVVSQLVGNEGARISDTAFQTALESFAYSDNVADAMTRRVNLPEDLAQRQLVDLTGRLKDLLSGKGDSAHDLAAKLVLQVRERTAVDLPNERLAEKRLEVQVDLLNRSGCLTPSLILRALCVGYLAFFEASLARQANVSLVNAHRLIHDPSGLGVQVHLSQGGLPRAALPVVPRRH